MRTPITDDEYWKQLRNFKTSVLRFEQQPAYWVGYERAQLDRFLAGDPESPDLNADLRGWHELVRRHVGAGRSMTRIRVLEEPPTDYQRWVLWLDRWNRDAGEQISYLTRAVATGRGIVPLAGADDWWLLDDERLMVMGYDAEGRRVRLELSTDAPDVQRARQVWQLAVGAFKHPPPQTAAT